MPRTCILTASPSLRSTAGWQQRRQTRRNRRHAEPGDQQERCGGADAPADHAHALTALQCACAVDMGRAGVNFGGKGGVANFKAFQSCAAAAAEAKDVVGSGEPSISS